MATAILTRVMHGSNDRSVHPFFSRPNGSCPTAAETEASSPLPAGYASDSEGDQSALQLDGTAEKPAKLKKSRAKNVIVKDGKKQSSLRDILNSNVSPSEPPAEPSENPTETTDEDINAPRRKRRRTSEIENAEVASTLPEGNSTKVDFQRDASPRVVIPRSSLEKPPAAEQDKALREAGTPPKKMLRLNASGKFSSPVLRDSTMSDAESTSTAEIPSKRRGRPRKTKESAPEKHLVVHIRYNRDQDASKWKETTGKIQAILLGELRVLPFDPLPQKRKRATPKKPTKPTHPFFGGKPKEKVIETSSPRKIAATTPGKLRAQTGHNTLVETWEVPFVSALLKDRLMVKHPGATEADWPSKGLSHVRGIGQDTSSPNVLRPGSSGRKQKASKRPLDIQDSVLSRFGKLLAPENDPVLRPDGYQEPHPSLRIPQRLVIPGEELARRVETQLSAAVADVGRDVLAMPASQPLVHPAIHKLHCDLSNALTALDEGRGELLGWAQKYPPQRALEVLQPGRKMTILKDWLTTLTVTAVESSTSGKIDEKGTKASCNPTKKRLRRKAADLDDFLVDDDEIVNDMDELTDAENEAALVFRKGPKSIVQGTGDRHKISNLVLLSGPHGCGKTAAAYAVAHELGFKVFEIGSSERRSGKDVLDKVGNMTENHLVKHHGTDTELSAAEDNSRWDQEFQKDLDSGKQGQLGAFFKPKISSKLAGPKMKKTSKTTTLEAVRKSLKRPPKNQQQSLILLEEVDVLFRDDKEFWSTVLKLIDTSKRPVIMTCNDEDLVPLQAMNLHAILRLQQPPPNLAVDYMLLIAAREGHLLERVAVSSLYKSKRSDLRASLTELDLWCQMGVGDPKAGLSWVYQRWPPGSDLDSEGRRLRVISRDTYAREMAVLDATHLSTDSGLLETWCEFGLQPAAALGWHSELALPRKDDVQYDVQSFSRMADMLSAVDTYSSPSFQDVLDTSQKPFSDRARMHYIEGLPLLQTDEAPDYTGLTRQIAVTSTRLAMQYITDGQPRTDNLLADSVSAKRALTRHDFTCLDPISWPSESALSSNPGLQLSSLDGPMVPLVTDTAPYIRSIVQYDLALEEQRNLLSSLDTAGSRTGSKRARTTRAARSALEGSQRASTRKERWFAKELDMTAVLATGGSDWPKTAVAVDDDDEERSVRDEGADLPASSAASELVDE